MCDWSDRTRSIVWRGRSDRESHTREGFTLQSRRDAAAQGALRLWSGPRRHHHPPIYDRAKKLKGITWLDDILCSAVSQQAVKIAGQEAAAVLRDRHHL